MTGEDDLADGFDIQALTAGFLEDPFPTYRALRENSPLHRNRDGSYFLTRYADLDVAYRHPAMSSDKKIDFKPNFGDGPLYTHHTTSLVFNDDPYHARVRKLLAAAFSPRKLAELEPLIERVIDDVLDGLEERGRFDLMDDFALVLPIEVIGNMLGVHREKRHLLHDYSNKILAALDPVITDKQLKDGNDAVDEFSAYLKELIDERRKDPDAGGQGEVLAALIFGEVDGESLSEVELIQNCIFLLNAGHETTANLTANGICLLMDHPDQHRRLKDDPGLIQPAVEEFLRYDSPVQLGNRRLTEDTELGGRTFEAGTYFHLAIGAANRDPEIFDDPETLDITRPKNPHFAFATSKHICLGATLARIEGRIAIGKLVERFPDIRRDGEPERMIRARFRGFSHVPVAI